MPSAFGCALGTMKPISIETQAIITGGPLGSKPWVIRTTNIEGTDFFEVDRKQNGLARFLGRASSLSQMNPLKNFKFFEQLRRRRNVTIRARQMSSNAGLGDVTLTEWGRRKEKKRKLIAGEDAQDSEPTAIEINLPEVSFAGITVDALTVRVKEVSNLNERVTIELSETNLEYIRIAALAAGEETDEKCVARSKKVPTGCSQVRWSKQKPGYVAWVSRGDKKRWKRFPSAPPEDADIALQRALKWVREDGPDADPEGDCANEWEQASPVATPRTPGTDPDSRMADPDDGESEDCADTPREDVDALAPTESQPASAEPFGAGSPSLSEVTDAVGVSPAKTPITTEEHGGEER